MCRTIAPTREMLALPPGEFEPAYEALLDQLDAAQIWREIHELAAPHEPVILCFEADRGECHRLQVARWFERELGVVVDEFEPEPALI
jgi:hypothetical protein